jgi:hypothetical protein
MARHATQKKPATRQRTARDRVLILTATEKLADFDGLDIKPQALREILTRFLELAKQEAARQPPGRPKSDFAGQAVAVLIEHGWPQARARQRVAKVSRKSLAAVARAHLRYQRENATKLAP